MDEERRPEEGQVHRDEESSQRNHALGSPAAKRHGHVSKKHGRVRTRAPVILVRGHLGDALHPGKHTQVLLPGWH